MSSNPFSLFGLSCLIIFHLLNFHLLNLPISQADIPLFSLNSPVSPKTICKSTPFPSSCISILPNRNANVYDFGRVSVQHSISQSQKFLILVDKHLQGSSTLKLHTIRALQDCRYLASLNLDFLSTCSKTVNRTSETLTVYEADNIQTLLSSILTNLLTCWESLESTDSSGTVKNYLSDSIFNDSKLHSVSLALFTEGWVPKRRAHDIASQPRAYHPTFGNGRLPQLKMSSRNRKIFESARRHRRQLAEVAANNGSVVVKDIVVVNKDGSGNFTTINDAITAAPNNSDASSGYFLIYVTAGEYQEYVSIPSNKKYLLMVGDGVRQTNITGNRSVGDGWTTFNSATFAVAAEGFFAVGITFRNTAGPSKGQAVAVRNGADLSTFYICSFEAYQDTLYAHSQRQFYRECDIYGTVDFIFGDAAAVFQNCNLFPRSRPQGLSNYITAQGRNDPNQNTGISIHNCTIKVAENLNATMSYLGRPWKDYSRTVYMQSFMDKLINPAGWRQWNANLSTIYYAEYNNTGPGSNTSMRVTWPGYHAIGATEAANFTVSNFLLGDNWLPRTGVPYTGGLI
ncbi:hypothetical protein FEM48_Zijuj06G0154100 [Ziziphus jujuba var. spinosa]|uniref:Pectinesterase n=1 Tax=Ziziphus jujuba var. spinosa TaxID=714518 RepID=A0A978VA31_ZIZJJ|nr:hypothetical protein FEM48_Zijuj06G0154100 [Ziziphus jujuba var. spinosa]